MRICFTLDDVLRGKTMQIGKVYKKYIDGDIDLDSLDFSTNEYHEIFKFDTKSEWNKFLYSDYAYEIFGEAPVTKKGVDKEFNLWHVSLQDFETDEDIEVLFANPFEFNASIGFTCFFLSKIATRVREIHFPMNSSDIWDKCDVLVTADPKLISEKPEGKICVKIKMPYNEDLEADYTYEDLSDALDGNKLLENIFNND
jgi:hypothetical protein